MSAVLDSWKLSPLKSIGLLPMANSIGVFANQSCLCLFTVAALRINWAGVIYDRVVLSEFLEAASASAVRNLLNNRTPISARFGQGVCGRVGNLLIL